MAYDEDLANRIRDLIADVDGVTEKRMFGGLAFLVGGNMAVAASGEGGLLVRVDPDETDVLAAKPNASPMVMRGRAAGIQAHSLRQRGDGFRVRPKACLRNAEMEQRLR